MKHFHWFEQSDLTEMASSRAGETRLGETMKVGLNPDADFIIIGLPESIGVQLNGGVSGTESLWPVFLEALLRVQDTEGLPGHKISLGGYLKPGVNLTMDELDQCVSEVVQMVVDHGSIPIIIGGGHNNAYGILKGISAHYKDSIHTINVDAHADLRALEGRHSGNGFSYAMAHKHLKNYGILGLHRNYNSRFITDYIESNANVLAYFYEDIFLEEKLSLEQALENLLAFTADKACGLEIDLDSIEYSLSSATTPCGLYSREVRKVVYKTCMDRRPAYLHLAEGATRLADGRQNQSMGKLACYFVTDFIRYTLSGHSNQ